MSQQVQNHVLKRYTLVKKIGSGAYGHVWKVKDKQDKKVYALKKIFDAFQHATDAKRTYREIVILRQLDHLNIVKLFHVIRAQNNKDLYLIFQFMQADLYSIVGQALIIRQNILEELHKKSIIYQILVALHYLHSAKLIHRDLKPSNVLINSQCLTKICDFGLVRSISQKQQQAVLTKQVATRWYRAPEVLLGSQSYSYPADVWSIGCILAQILIKKPLFSGTINQQGNSTLNQLQHIISFTGIPSNEDIDSIDSVMIRPMLDELRLKNKKKVFDQCEQKAADLVKSMLQFNPEKRITIKQALQHPYLSQVRNTFQQRISNQQIVPEVNENVKLSMKEYRFLIYEEIKKYYENRKEEKKQQFWIKNNSVDKRFKNKEERNYRRKSKTNCKQKGRQSIIKSYSVEKNKNSNSLYSSYSTKKIKEKNNYSKNTLIFQQIIDSYQKKEKKEIKKFRHFKQTNPKYSALSPKGKSSYAAAYNKYK